MRFIYNCLLPFGFLCYLPGLVWKYYCRGGFKKNYAERFGRFKPSRIQELKEFEGAIWIHAVSVGETVAALGLVRAYLKGHPQRKIVISTTTTTGQELARKNMPERCTAIFCPIDFVWMVRRTLDLLKPAEVIIFETEIWPNLVCEARRRDIPVALVNARMSDRSFRGYSKLKCFFGPLLAKFNLIMAQSEHDAERYKALSSADNVVTTGNLKFDQQLPENLKSPGYDRCFGLGMHTILLAASTHSGEEALIAETYKRLRKKFADFRLVLVPRHAERGGDVAELLTKLGLTFHRRSSGVAPEQPVDVELADTTGEMISLMHDADLVIMGKSLAGHDEGHNLIEPALLDKPIITGRTLRNFRFILSVLQDADAVATVGEDAELEPVLEELIADRDVRLELGRKAGEAIRRHAGATARTMENMDRLIA